MASTLHADRALIVAAEPLIIMPAKASTERGRRPASKFAFDPKPESGFRVQIEHTACCLSDRNNRKTRSRI